MNKLLVVLGRALASIGIVASIVAILARSAGYFWIGSVTSAALLQGGMAFVIVAVLCFVAR